jgi:hypothetical protein
LFQENFYGGGSEGLDALPDRSLAYILSSAAADYRAQIEVI